MMASCLPSNPFKGSAVVCILLNVDKEKISLLETRIIVI